MATWTQALDQVRLGNVRLKNNIPFSVNKFYYLQEKFDTTPPIIMEVDTNGTINEKIIEFKDGGIFGFGYTGTDTRIHLYMFVKLPDYDIVGQTPAGTNYTWYSEYDAPTFFNVTISGQSVPVYYRKFALAFSIPTNNDGTWYQYVMWYIAYPTVATNEDYMYQWLVNYGEALPWHTRGEFGYPQTDSHVVDYLAGETNPPTEYPGESNTSSGGHGTFIFRNDEMDLPPTPDMQAIDFGFNTIYTCDESEMRQIAAWLWSDDFDQNIKLNYVSPFENILTIAIVPTNVIDWNNGVAPAIMRVGNVEATPMIATTKILKQYTDVDCGILDVSEYWENFLDYDASYTIFLPYIGFRSIKSSDLLNCYLRVQYKCDLLTGSVTCFIRSYNKTDDGNNQVWHTLYTYNGNMFYNIAFSGANFMSLYNQQLSATTSGINNAVGALTNLATGNLPGVLSNIMGIGQAQREYETAKPDYGRGGNNGGNAGFMNYRVPFLVESMPIGATPEKYLHHNGAPLQAFKQLSTLSGYTEIGSINLDNINASTAERTELMQLLKSGIYL